MNKTKTTRQYSMLKGFGMAVLFGAAVLATLPANAKPAKHGIVMQEQPDGTVLPVRLMGDEHAHRTFSEDGYLLMEDASGFMTYATVDANGEIVASSRRAVAADKRTDADKSFLRNLDKEAMTAQVEAIDVDRREQRNATMNARRAKANRQGKINSQGINLLFSDFPSEGVQKALVILVEYQDVSFSMSDPQDYFYRMLNENGFSQNGNNASARDYFCQNSNNKFQPDFDVYGPVKLKNNRSYYGGNDYYGNDNHPEEMVIEACQQLDATVDFSQYDDDGDGYIDNVYVFYAGKGEADGGGNSTVWPHSWNVTNTGAKYYFDNVLLDRYACSNEIDNTTQKPDGIGTFVHEFSHVMGLPDLYSTAYNNAFTPGAWSVLDYGPYNNNGCTPPNYSIFERYALGWMEPAKFEGTGTFPKTLEPITTNNGYLVKTTNNKEFILIEVRNQEGFDTYLPNSGMLVWRIDYDQTAWKNNTVNNTAARQRVDLIEADNIKSDYSVAGDCFPGTANVTAFTRSTTPAFTTRLGRSMNVELDNISLNNDGTVSFDAICELESGVDETTGNNGMNIAIDGRTLSVEADAPVRIITPAGVTVANMSNGNIELPAAGIYIVTDGNSTRKVIVK